MAQVKYTLVSEGPSDQALLPIIDWIFRAQRSDLAVNREWANPEQLPTNTKELPDKIRASMEFFPCDVLFIHRDCDNETPEARRAEIEKATLSIEKISAPYICVIPVKTMEAWLLFDENALREYVGNPKGKADLNLPKLRRIEEAGKPKEILQNALQDASHSRGRRKKSYDNTDSLIELALSIENYAPLRVLPAFNKLEDDIKAYLASRNEQI